MSKLGKIIALGLLLLGILASTPSFAQVSRTTEEQAPTMQTTPTVPGVMSLFFKDLGQRVQLWFTFNEEADTDLRITFAEDNLSLARYIAGARLSADAEAKAVDLAARSNELSRSVAERLEAWANNKQEVKPELIDRTRTYFRNAQDLLAEITANLSDPEQRQQIEATNQELKIQLTKVEEFIDKGNTGSRGIVDQAGIMRPTRDRDRDRDGIDDQTETDLGLSTENFDTDGDGLSDRAEIEKYGTDPNNKDTDGDGFKDAVEVLEGYNPRGTGNGSTILATSSLKFINTTLVKTQLKPETLEYLKAVVKNYEVKKN